MYVMYNVFHVHVCHVHVFHVQCMSCTMYVMYNITCVQCISCTMYVMYMQCIYVMYNTIIQSFKLILILLHIFIIIIIKTHSFSFTHLSYVAGCPPESPFMLVCFLRDVKGIQPSCPRSVSSRYSNCASVR